MEIVTDGSTLVLRGDFDARSTWQVRNAINEHLEQHDDVVVDMTEVGLIDMTAIKVLAFATRRAASAGHHLTLRNACPAVRRMLHLSRMRRILEVEHAASA
jgi:anti-anti-sigma factor